MSTVVYNSQYLNGSPASTIIQGAETAPITDLDGREGWLFVKPVANAAKFNYFFYGEGSKPVTLGDIKNIYCNISNDNYVGSNSNPFIVVHTKPTGVGDAGFFYHSSLKYNIPTDINIQSGELITIHSHQGEGVPKFGLQKVWANFIIQEGPALATEEILYISVHTDSASPINTQVLVQAAGYSTNNQHHPVNKITKYISA